MEVGDRSTRKALEYRLFSKADYLQTRLLAARGASASSAATKSYALALESLRFQNSDANEKMRVRANAALALGAIGDPRALPALETLAETDTDARTQVAASYAICPDFEQASGRRPALTPHPPRREAR